MFAKLSLTLLTLSTATLAQFPSNPFFIRNIQSGKILDVEGGSTEPGAGLILWDRQGSNFGNQLWTYERGRLVSNSSGLFLELPGVQKMFLPERFFR